MSKPLSFKVRTDAYARMNKYKQIHRALVEAGKPLSETHAKDSIDVIQLIYSVAHLNPADTGLAYYVTYAMNIFGRILSKPEAFVGLSNAAELHPLTQEEYTQNPDPKFPRVEDFVLDYEKRVAAQLVKEVRWTYDDRSCLWSRVGIRCTDTPSANGPPVYNQKLEMAFGNETDIPGEVSCTHFYPPARVSADGKHVDLGRTLLSHEDSVLYCSMVYAAGDPPQYAHPEDNTVPSEHLSKLYL